MRLCLRHGLRLLRLLLSLLGLLMRMGLRLSTTHALLLVVRLARRGIRLLTQQPAGLHSRLHFLGLATGLGAGVDGARTTISSTGNGTACTRTGGGTTTTTSSTGSGAVCTGSGAGTGAGAGGD